MSTEAGGYIAIVGWDEMTHRDAQRGPGPLPWHRTFTRLERDDAYLQLTPGARALLHGLALVYGSERGQLSFDAKSLGRRLNLRITSQQVEALSHAGFIRICASIEQAQRWHEASPRAARELERESKPKDVKKGLEERPVDNLNGRRSLDAVLPLPVKPEAEELERLERARARIGRGLDL